MKRREVRDEQLAARVTEELALVMCSAEDLRLSEFEITRVEPGGGGGCFTVHVVPCEGSQEFGSLKEMKEFLARSAPYLRTALAEGLNLKRAPELSLTLDPLYVLAMSNAKRLV